MSPQTKRKTVLRKQERIKKSPGNEIVEPFLLGKEDPTQSVSHFAHFNTANDEEEIRKLQKLYRKKAQKLYKENEDEMDDFVGLNSMALGKMDRKSGHHAIGKSVKSTTWLPDSLAEEEEGLLLGFVHGIPRDLQEFAQVAHTLECVQKLTLGHFEDLSFEDVEELFKHMGTTSEGKVELRKIELVLTHLLEPPCAKDEVAALLQPYADYAHNDYLGVELSETELLNLFNKQSQHLQKFRKLREDHHVDISKETLRSHLERIVDRHDYFLTFPNTLFNLFLFLFVVLGHLRIFERSRLETSLEEFVNGRDPRETCDENVDDMDSFWEYLGGRRIIKKFGKVVKSSLDSAFDHCTLASRNILIGDVQIRQKKFDGAEYRTWLLHSNSGASYLASHPGEYWDAAKFAALTMQSEGADHPDIYLNEVRFNTYNEYARMFTLTKVVVQLGRHGDVLSRISSDSVSAVAYPEWSLYIVDAAFTFTTLHIIARELQDFFVIARLGWEVVKDYADFWQLVDWIACCGRVWTVVSWMLCMFTMWDPKLQDLVNSSDGKLKVDVMALSADDLESIMAQLYKVRLTYFLLQLGCAANILMVIARFFKAFNANPRLKVVQATFLRMLPDFAHFMIVFATIFLPFILVAHILFGQDMQEFASLTSSINTGFYMLMGEFGFYADVAPTHAGAILPSGKLLLVFTLWYVLYMILIFLVLLNLMLAIVLKHYDAETIEVKKTSYHPPIWRQAQDYWNFTRDAKDFLPIKSLLLKLEDERDSAKDSKETVCAHWLMEAWPEMTPAQAIWLICNLQEELHKEKEAKDRSTSDEDLHRHVEENFAKIIEELCYAIFDESEREEKEEVERKLLGEILPRQRFRPKVDDTMTTERAEMIKGLSKNLHDAKQSIEKLLKNHDSLSQKVNIIDSSLAKRSGKQKKGKSKSAPAEKERTDEVEAPKLQRSKTGGKLS